MPTALTRRGFLASTGVAALVAACGSDRPGAVAEDGSVTVTHVFGQTRIPAPPTRVVSAGLTEQDDLLVLGVVPIGVTEWFGGEPFAVWPWAQPRLGGAQPVVLNLADGLQVDPIAALTPDLIVAANAGLDADTYARLSDIAPTVAQPTPAAFFGPWKDRATIIGQAVFKADEMAGQITAIDEKFSAAGRNHPQFAGKSAVLLRGALHRDGAQATVPGWRTEFLTQLGFTVPDVPALIPRDRMAESLGAADVLIWTTESDEEQAALQADPTVARLNPRQVFTGRELAAAIAFASPLSYPLVADRLPDQLAAVLG